MKVKWKIIYYPIGELVDCETGAKRELSAEIRRNHCSIGGRKIIFVFTIASCPAGHGEPAMSAEVPAYFYDDTLEPAPRDSIVEISGCHLHVKEKAPE